MAGGSAGSSTHLATSGRSACLWEPGRRAKRRAKIEAEQPPTRPKPTTEDGAFMEPRGCNRWQSAANRLGPKPAEVSQIGCHRLPPVARDVHGKQGVCGGLPPCSEIALMHPTDTERRMASAAWLGDGSPRAESRR